MRRGTKTLLAVLLSTSMLAGCVTDQNQGQVTGTVIGAVAGGLAGSLLGRGTGRIVAIAIGTGVGALIGNQLGKMLDEKDQQAVASQSQVALASAKDGQSITWNNPDSGASAVITPVSTSTQTRQMTVVRDKRVAAPQSLAVIGKTYETKKAAVLRAGPEQGSDQVGALKAGERFQAIGSVGKDWVLVGRNNRSIGYVHASLVREAAPRTAVAAAAPAKAAPAQQQAAKAPADLDLEPITDKDAAVQAKAAAAPIDLDAEGLVAETVVVEQSCRRVEMQVASKGQQEKQAFDACRGQDGSWEIL